MITAMCAAQGVEVNPSKKIRTTIDKRYIELYCTNHNERQARQQEPPPPKHELEE
ncbi:hypothetical protein SESBI_10225 [Sesbania bispinosa]|nr:hypothetical protein SESBI_10225 [Sesbania bispinosa]